MSAATAVGALAAAVCLTVTSCSLMPSPPSADTPGMPASPAIRSTESALPAAQDFSEAERASLRIRNIGCQGVSTGSGFAIDKHVLVTNRHVVGGATRLEVSTYDGRDVTVTADAAANIADLAVVVTREALDQTIGLAAANPDIGEEVTAVGFPLGGQLTTTQGKVLGYEEDPIGWSTLPMLLNDAPIEHGSSGSPLLNTDGEVVGVVYAGDGGARQFAVPVEVLSALISDPERFNEESRCGGDLEPEGPRVPGDAIECSDMVFAGAETSCPFALNVADAWAAAGGGASRIISAYSPVTEQHYVLTCEAEAVVVAAVQRPGPRCSSSEPHKEPRVSPRLVPTEPVFATESEREAWQALVEQAPDDWTILANLRLTDETKDWEFDLVVLMPGVGVVVAEVKGGSRHRRETACGGRGRRRTEPASSTRSTKRATASTPSGSTSQRTRGGRAPAGPGCASGHTVITPRTTLHADFATPDCPRWSIHGKATMGDLAGRLWDIAARQESGHRVPTADDCDLIAEILARPQPAPAEPPRRGRRAGEPSRPPDRRAGEHPRRDAADQPARGPRWRRQRQDPPGHDAGQGADPGEWRAPPQRVALLCYSHRVSRAGSVARWTGSTAGTGRRSAGRSRTSPGTSGSTSSAAVTTRGSGRSGCPRRMVELAAAVCPRASGSMPSSSTRRRTSPTSGGRRSCAACATRRPAACTSTATRTSASSSGSAGPRCRSCPLVLDHNLRNTRQIAETFGPLAPMRMHARGGDGPEVTYVPCSVEDALDGGGRRRRRAARGLASRGRRAADHRRPARRAGERQEQLGQDGYWDTFWDADQVFYGHVLGFKGLERRVVVLCANETGGQGPLARAALRRAVPRHRQARRRRSARPHRARSAVPRSPSASALTRDDRHVPRRGPGPGAAPILTTQGHVKEMP